MRLGLETLAKRAYRGAAWRGALWRARLARHPSYAFFEERLRPQAWRLERLVVIPERNLVYIPIEKNASSKTRRLLAEFRGIRNPFAVDERSRFRTTGHAGWLPVRELYRVLKAPDRFVFAVVRDPYRRTWSCWANKFRDAPLVPSRRLRKPTPEVDTYLRLRASIDPALPAGEEARLSLDQYLAYVAGIIDGWADAHVVPQARFLDLDFAPPDHLVRLETYERDMLPVLERLRAPGLAARLGEKVNRDLKEAPMTLTAGQRRAIEELYRADFEALGYATR